MTLPDALAAFETLVPAGRPRAVFLDFDGTLAPIVDRPEDAKPAPGMGEVLARLAKRMPVALVSGRDLDDLRRRTPIEGLVHAGSHGYAIEGPGIHYEVGAEYLPDLDRVESALKATLDEASGFQVERKRFAVAVHFRRAGPDGEGDAVRAVAAALENQPRLKATEGKMIREIRPVLDWHKGKAVRWLLDRWRADARDDPFPVFIGDDVTDEDAIRALGKDGLGIMVGDVPFETRARARLEDIDAVRAFLELLAA